MLTDKKVTDTQLSANGVVSAPDRLTGTAAENKAVFDKLIRLIVASCLNPVIDELSGTGGASAVGASVAGMAGETVQTILSAYKTMLDDRYTKEQTDGTFYDKAVVDALLKQSIEQGGSAGSLIQDITVDGTLLTITKYDGTQLVIDTGKVSRSRAAYAVLAANGWEPLGEGFAQRIAVEGLEKNAPCVAGISPEATQEQWLACAWAQIRPGEQEEGSIRFVVSGECPVVNLPILIQIMG